MKKYILVLAMILMATGLLQAQARLKRKGDALYAKLAYELAIPYYEHYLKKADNNDATMKLANCYRLTHNYDKAAEWYGKVVLIQNAPPISYYYAGHALMQQGNLEAAKEMFAMYDGLAMDDKRGKNFVQAIDRYADLLKDSMRVELKAMPFNTPDSEFGIFPYQKGYIIAAAHQENAAVVREFNWLKTPFLNFYFVTHGEDSTGWTTPELIKGDVNTRYHESNFTMADGSTEFFFTRNNFIDKQKGKSEEGVIKLKLYKGQINDLETSAIEELPLNSDDYSTTHPSISADGQTLYFASDMPGGEGGKDIYYCTRAGDGWSAPVNMKDINTSGDEMFPFIQKDGTFYFSSDGHPGLGHLDIFYVKPQGDRQVVNMGFPINSAWDDFAFYMDGNNEDGFLSSDREGGQGRDDIYQFKLRRPVLEIYVLDSIAELPIEGATVRVRDLTDNSEQSFVTDSSGAYSFKTYFAHAFEITVETPEFGITKTTMSTDAASGELVFRKDVNLWTPPPSITGLVIDDSTQERLPGSEVEFVDLRRKENQIRVADRNGRFHIKLEPSTYYEINVRKKGYMTYTARVSTTLNAFDGDTIIPLKLEKIPFNKPIRLKNIHYDFDKWTIRADAYNDLIYLANLMKKNPTLIVELGSHTDCRGSDSYNQVLSQKRAVSARIFLIDLGIDPMRIQAKGYGESQISNQCKDGVACAEPLHDDNRRTEFKIIGEIEGVDMKNSVLETKQGN